MVLQEIGGKKKDEEKNKRYFIIGAGGSYSIDSYSNGNWRLRSTRSKIV
jgi:hypothetical protein